MTSAYDDEGPLGYVPTTGRGSLPYATIDGEPLVALASFALEDAGAVMVDFDVPFDRVRDLGRPLVVHDPLCPLTPIPFLHRAFEVADSEDVVVVGVLPVTDTIKTATGDVVGETVDRESLWLLASPVVLPPKALAGLDDWSDFDDLAGLVTRLRAAGEVRLLEAPALARRVDDPSSVVLLEALAAEAADVAGAASGQDAD